MSLNFTTNTLRALDELSIEPNIAVQIEGFDVLFSANSLQEFITINCPGFFVGEEGFFIGGLKDLTEDENKRYIDSRNTTYTIRQNINYTEGESSTITTMNVGLVDKNEFVTRLISPGLEIDDILGRKIRVYVTFGNASFFEDSVLIFKGYCVTVTSGPGTIILKINAPDTRKNIELFNQVETTLSAAINGTQTTIPLENASEFLVPGGGLRGFARVEDTGEIFEYTSVSQTALGGVTRGQAETLPSAAIPDDPGNPSFSEVTPIYGLAGNPLDLALQIMLSGYGVGQPAYEDIAVSSFVQIGAGSNQMTNAIYFDQVDIPILYGVVPGDMISVTGAINSANNLSNAVVSSVQRTDSGFAILIEGANFVLEQNSTAVIATFSQYNVLPIGMSMRPDDVDIVEHLKIRDFFHSSVEMFFYLKDEEINGKEFIAEQLYKPIACYELPRKASASVGFTVGPIPGEDIRTVDITNVKNPSAVTIQRSSARAFYNSIVYRFDEDQRQEDESFRTGRVFVSQDSANRIDGVDRTFAIDALGLRSELNGQNIADQNSSRLLDRYEFGAEIVTGQILLRDFAEVEVGDIVIGDLEQLHVSDITNGSRVFRPRLFEVLDKTMNLKTGNINFQLLDTSIGIDERFGLMSPCSNIMSVINSNQIVIGPDPIYSSRFENDEFRKWLSVTGVNCPISVNISDASGNILGDLVVTSISGNTFTFDQAPSFAILPGMMVEFSGYEDPDTNDKQQLIYGYMTNNTTFTDGENQYSMI